MGANSKIEWCDHTFNPWEGCTKKSPGCKHCYAETRNKRFAGGRNWGKGNPRRHTSAANWQQPIKWNREAEIHFVRPRVFCASLADWLDPEVPWEWRRDLLDLAHKTPNLDWLLLTKNPEHFRELMLDIERNIHLYEAEENKWNWLFGWVHYGDAPLNVWLGTSVEDQKRAEERIPLLLNIPAKIRFLSCEPLLEAVELHSTLGGTRWIGGQRGCYATHRGIGTPDCPRELHHHHDERCKPGIDWVIVGGESGPKARPCSIDWIRMATQRCQQNGVPVFVKQLGSNVSLGKSRMIHLSDKKGGDPSEWPEDIRIRQFPR